ncbi:MAG TPA: sugar ABC transporter ATP-binding protein [Gemmatimonadaceae bacterium]|nr:sugar ABC transporter ATP-binding protein [Gemmatimonadaceae bacterium]
MTDLLEVTNVHKRFGGVHALRAASLSVREGEVHALVGENGAGKSTLINILAGAVRRDAGRVVFTGREVDFHTPRQSQGAGIAVIHQDLVTLPALSVAENLLMGRMPARSGWLDRTAMRLAADEQLAQVGLEIDPRTPMRDLSLSQQQLVEIARALSAGARLLVMDEPSSALTEYEAQRLLELVRRVRSRGVAVLYVSHRMAEVFAIADRITVYRDGAYVGTVAVAVTTPGAVISMMVGRDLAVSTVPKAPRDPEETILEVRGLARRDALRDVSLTVRRGEIVGLAGLVGAGRSEVARAIFGADRFDAGEIYLEGRRVRFRSPADAIRAGVAMVPEDRKGLALFLEQPVRSNISMVRLPTLARAGVVKLRRERALAVEQSRRLRIRAAGIEAPVRSLSGGNQQKTVLARWLAMRPKLLVLDEPTHGVDVGAKAEIYALIRALAADGVAILLISSELPEVLDLSDRIVVMREGRVAAVLDRAQADEHTVMLHATGTISVSS